MLSKLLGELALFKYTILFSAIVLITFTVGSMLLVRSIKWKSVALKFYGILHGLKRGKMAALALILTRMLFFWSCIAFPFRLEIPHIIFGALIIVVLHLILGDPETLLYDMLCSVLIYGGIYVKGLLDAYLSGVRVRAIVVAMQLVLAIFIFLAAIFETIICVRCIAERALKIRRKMRLMNAARLAGVFLAGAVITFLPYYLINQVDTVMIRQDVFQYTDKGKVLFPGSSKVIKSGNGCVLQNGSQLVELDRTPLYYKEEDRIMITGVVSIIQPGLSLTNRIGNMSLLYEQDKKYFVQSESRKTKVANFFLFDGKDTYIFFEPVTIGWNDKTLELAPFSFITVRYNQTIRYFDTAAGSCTTIDTGICNAMVTMQCGARISLSTDILYREDGQEQMLFLQPNLLEDLK
jgi:hypothetical protein